MVVGRWALVCALSAGVAACGTRGTVHAAAAGSGTGTTPRSRRYARLLPRLRTRIRGVVHDSGRVEQAFDQAFQEISDDRAVRHAGHALFQRLGRDPAIDRAGNAILHQVMDSPEFARFVRTFRARHPDDFAHALTEHVERAADDSGLDAALSGATDELMDRPRVKDALGGVTRALLSDDSLTAAFVGAFQRVLTRPDVSRRVSVRVGVPQSDPHFEGALAAYLSDSHRVQKLLVGFARAFGEEPAPRRAVVRIFRSRAFFEAVRKPAVVLLSDPDFRGGAARALTAMLVGAGQPQVDARVRSVITSRAAEDATCAWLSSVSRAPEVTSPLDSAVIEVAESPEFETVIERVYVGMPRNVARLTGLHASGA